MQSRKPHARSKNSHRELKRLGKYELKSPIRPGKKSVVFRAFDGEREVAVKVLKSEFATNEQELLRFYSEAKLALQFQHENIAPAYEVACDRGIHFVVLPWAEHGTLKDFVRKHGPLWEEDAIAVIEKLRAGLDEIHRFMPAHGKLHPGNILMLNNQHPMIKGLGGIPESSDSNENSHASDPDVCSAPEALDAQQELNLSADDYSLSATLFFMLTGRMPFKKTPLKKLLQTKRRRSIAWSKWIPTETSRGARAVVKAGLLGRQDARSCGDIKLANRYKKNVTLIGNFEVRELIASGSSTCIYLATDAQGSEVALKVLRPEAANSQTQLIRFYQASKLLMQLNHPNLPRGIEVGQSEEHHYFAMEHFPSEGLNWKLKENGPFGEMEALSIIRQAASAVGVLHQNGLVHRNINPSNLILDETGHVQLVDLGLVKNPCQNYGLTLVNMRVGSPSYSSPEQFLDSVNADPQMDVYSLGVTLYVLLSGQLPTRGKSQADQFQKKRRNKHQSLRKTVPSLSEATTQLVMRAIHAERNTRHQNVHEFLQGVEECKAAVSNNNQPVTAKKKRTQPQHLRVPSLQPVVSQVCEWFSDVLSIAKQIPIKGH